MKRRLSKVYLDDSPVALPLDEAAPPLSRIVQAGGQRPDAIDVVLLASPSDKKGRLVEFDEVIDRAAEPTRPIYLRTVPHDVKPIYAVGPARPNQDPVIAQLGADPLRAPHEPAVFRAPSQFPKPPPGPGATGAGKKNQRLAARRAEAQARAEAEAEQRQEEERNHEDALQDEVEAAQDADEDSETQ
jgi:hypothetical protein